MPFQHTFRRTLTLAPAAVYQPLIDGIPTIKDCTIVDAGNPIRVARKRNILANRWAMTATVTIDGSDLVVTVEGNGTNQRPFAMAIFDLLPEGAIDDHGLAAALENMSAAERLFSALEMATLLDDLRAGERIVQLVAGTIGGRKALIIVTTKRILTKETGFTDSATAEILPQQITSISAGHSLTSDWLNLTVSGVEMAITKMQRGRADQLAEHIRRLREGHGDNPEPESTTPAAPAVASPAAPTVSVDDLQRLAELHERGILTDEEFAAAKAKALGL